MHNGDTRGDGTEYTEKEYGGNMEETSKESNKGYQQNTYSRNNSNTNISYLESTKWSIVEESGSHGHKNQ